MSRANRPQLDGLRAICIIFTIFNHVPAGPAWINGSVGVDVFFALSGWLITWLLLEERAQSGVVNLRAFYTRRLFRIAPLYFLTIALYFMAAAAMAKLTGRKDDLIDVQSAFPWLATFNSEYRPTTTGNLFGHAWTLGIEEKFYLFWPAALALLGRRIWLALAVAAATYIVAILLADGSSLLVRGYLGLGFGAIAAVIATRHDAMARAAANSPVLYLAVLMACACYFGSLWSRSAVMNLGVSLAAAVIVANLWSRGDTLLARLLSWKPLAMVGKLTFGIYLIHVLVINFTALCLGYIGLKPGPWMVFATSYAISIAAAAVLYVLIEKPLIVLGRRLAMGSKPAPLPAAA